LKKKKKRETGKKSKKEKILNYSFCIFKGGIYIKLLYNIKIIKKKKIKEEK
jgi:hypothetical protein